MRQIWIPLLILSMVFCSCKNSSTSKDEVLVTKVNHKALDMQKLRYLFDNVEAIDFIFHNLPFSINQTDRPSVQTTIAGMVPMNLPDISCNSMGRLFMQVKGEIVSEAEIYFQEPDCTYFVFYEDKLEVGSAGMKDGTKEFYRGLIKNAQGVNN